MRWERCTGRWTSACPKPRTEAPLIGLPKRSTSPVSSLHRSLQDDKTYWWISTERGARMAYIRRLMAGYRGEKGGPERFMGEITGQDVFLRSCGNLVLLSFVFCRSTFFANSLTLVPFAPFLSIQKTLLKPTHLRSSIIWVGLQCQGQIFSRSPICFGDLQLVSTLLPGSVWGTLTFIGSG